MTRDLLIYLISGGGSAVIVSWFMDTPLGLRIRERITALLAPWLGVREFSRYLAIVLTTGVALAAYCLAAAAGYVPWPADAIGWSDLILELAGIAFTGSQIIHGATSLRRADRRSG